MPGNIVRNILRSLLSKGESKTGNGSVLRNSAAEGNLSFDLLLNRQQIQLDSELKTKRDNPKSGLGITKFSLQPLPSFVGVLGILQLKPKCVLIIYYCRTGTVKLRATFCSINKVAVRYPAGLNRRCV